MSSTEGITIYNGQACAHSNSDALIILGEILRNPTRANILIRMNGKRHLADIARELDISDQDLGFHMRWIRKLPKEFLDSETRGRKTFWRAKIDFSRVYFNLSES